MAPPSNVTTPSNENDTRNLKIDPCVVRAVSCLFLILNVYIIIFGITKINECPINIMIPGYLIAAGMTNVLSVVFLVTIGKGTQKSPTSIINTVYTVQAFWLGLGSQDVYKYYKPNFTEGTDSYCNETLYWFAFWLLTIYWILIALLIFLACCCMCLGFINRHSEPSDEHNRVT